MTPYGTAGTMKQCDSSAPPLPVFSMADRAPLDTAYAASLVNRSVRAGVPRGQRGAQGKAQSASPRGEPRMSSRGSTVSNTSDREAESSAPRRSDPPAKTVQNSPRRGRTQASSAFSSTTMSVAKDDEMPPTSSLPSRSKPNQPPVSSIGGFQGTSDSLGFAPSMSLTTGMMSMSSSTGTVNPRGTVRGTRRIRANESSRNQWFESLFGVKEAQKAGSAGVALSVEYDQTQLMFDYSATAGGILTCKRSGETWQAGQFHCPSLQELKQHTPDLAKADLEALDDLQDIRVNRVKVLDVSALHPLEENKFALFQAASQFNCLEMAEPDMLPEHGITPYSDDHTQGPACATACAAGAVVRNYFVPLKEGIGQTEDRQVNNLREALEALGSTAKEPLIDIQNGYTMSDNERLLVVDKKLKDFGLRDTVRDLIRVGIMADTEVTGWDYGNKRFKDEFPDRPAQLVSQIYCAACAIAYNDEVVSRHWEVIARLVLEANYEATLYAALENARAHPGERSARKVFLTDLGGGVFGNDAEWIEDARNRALSRFRDAKVPLDVIILSAGPVQMAPAPAIRVFKSPDMVKDRISRECPVFYKAFNLISGLMQQTGPDMYFHHSDDRCFCGACLQKRENGKEKFIRKGIALHLPKGYCRMALPVSRDWGEALGVWDSWIQCFHPVLHPETVPHLVETMAVLHSDDNGPFAKPRTLGRGGKKDTKGKVHFLSSAKFEAAAALGYGEAYRDLRLALQVKLAPQSIEAEEASCGKCNDTWSYRGAQDELCPRCGILQTWKRCIKCKDSSERVKGICPVCNIKTKKEEFTKNCPTCSTQYPLTATKCDKCKQIGKVTTISKVIDRDGKILDGNIGSQEKFTTRRRLTHVITGLLVKPPESEEEYLRLLDRWARTGSEFLEIQKEMFEKASGDPALDILSWKTNLPMHGSALQFLPLGQVKSDPLIQLQKMPHEIISPMKVAKGWLSSTQCQHWERARRFLVKQGKDCLDLEGMLDAKAPNICWCKSCYPEGPELYQAGNPARAVETPKGWSEFKVRTPWAGARMKAVMANWQVSYHSSNHGPLTLAMVVKRGSSLLKAGDHTFDGLHLRVADGHLTETKPRENRYSGRPELFDPASKFFTTPGWGYIDIPCYMKSMMFEGKELRMMLKLRSRPYSFTVGHSTMGDRYLDNSFEECAEYYSDRYGSHIIESVMIAEGKCGQKKYRAPQPPAAK